MDYAIYEDLVGVDPITIHKSTCKWYINRKIGATTSSWILVETKDLADRVGEKIANSKGCKRCNDCLDGARIVNPRD